MVQRVHNEGRSQRELEKDISVLLITRIYHEIFDFGEIAEDWQKARVKPLYKGKGSLEEARKYRCISLTSNIYKAFTSIVSYRLD